MNLREKRAKLHMFLFTSGIPFWMLRICERILWPFGGLWKTEIDMTDDRLTFGLAEIEKEKWI